MKYYKYQSPEDPEQFFVGRINMAARPPYSEIWDRKLKKWVQNEDVLWATEGFQSDCASYFEISKKEAESFIEHWKKE